MAETAEVAWSRVQTMSTKLIEALDALDDAGGLRRLSASWPPKTRDRARSLLGEARKALEGASAQLKSSPPDSR